MSKTLYRDPVNGKIAGVCAGIADYFSVEIWLVRILTVSAFLIGFSLFVIIAYIAAVLILEKRPKEESELNQEPSLKKNTFQQNKSASKQLLDIEMETKKMEEGLAKMEAYVTSSEFELNRKFKHL